MTTLRSILCGVRSDSRPARTELAKAASAAATDGKDKALLLSSGGRKGLAVISALEGVVDDEGEVRRVKFRTAACFLEDGHECNSPVE